MLIRVVRGLLYYVWLVFTYHVRGVIEFTLGVYELDEKAIYGVLRNIDFEHFS